MNPLLKELETLIQGEVHVGHTMRVLYATDASVYRELPAAVVLPKNTADIQALIRFAARYRMPLIPRAAGTSLAGQCVGTGIVVDVSKYMNRILELNVEEGWVRVEPGVIRDELNQFLEPHGLLFGPNTSTSNRCMIGGMVGNNSCGSTSIVYGTTRDHILELDVVLSDGSTAVFDACSPEQFFERCEGTTLEARLYRQVHQLLMEPEHQTAIRAGFPKAAVQRRNTGYALDSLLDTTLFEGDQDFNFCKLLAGSEGTLAFTTAIKLHLNPLPPPAEVVLAVHFESVQAALQATVIAMQHQPYACELMDKVILDCTKENESFQRYRFFVEGDPQAILCLECRGAQIRDAEKAAETIKTALQAAGLGYAFPVIQAPDSKKVWTLRKAGLGLLANIPGDAKAVACIEDTAVAVADLPAYIQEFESLLAGFGQRAVYYAHAGAGELHLRPILNLKEAEGRKAFRDISEATARLVAKFGGSLSGEHGDGRVRAEFIPLVLGEKNYRLFQAIKSTWDPLQLFNPGKITDAPPMDVALRYEADADTPAFDTLFDFSKQGGFMRAVEQCNGSGDCRKLPGAGGTMCPSYQATRNEKETTRGRANVLRELLTRHQMPDNPFRQPAIKEVLDLCLSCKGCTAECPSNVDMAGLKAEFLYQYYRRSGLPLRNRLFARTAQLNAALSKVPWLYNSIARGALSKKVLGVAEERSIPPLAKKELRRWYRQQAIRLQPKQPVGEVYFFMDAFTQYLDVEIGQKTLQLL
ncbi:MAG: FAD-binding protein, partial [Phaeodactylibacter sp.]|nr:FAD-binding protein [Phaeodactylibacter sp.]